MKIAKPSAILEFELFFNFLSKKGKKTEKKIIKKIVKRCSNSNILNSSTSNI